jgi:hypothetical protein
MYEHRRVQFRTRQMLAQCCAHLACLSQFVVAVGVGAGPLAAPTELPPKVVAFPAGSTVPHLVSVASGVGASRTTAAGLCEV